MLSIIMRIFCVISLLLTFNVASAEPEYRYDDAGRVVRIIHEDGSITSYSYDSHGNRIKNADGNKGSLEFDSNGKVAPPVTVQSVTK